MLTKWGRIIGSIGRNSQSSYAEIGNHWNVFPEIYNSSPIPVYIEMKTVAGDTMFISPYLSNPSASMITTSLVASGSSSSTGVAIGSGNTPPTEYDYTLESQITGITSGSKSYAIRYDSTEHKYIVDILYPITNNTGEQITINEIGYFVNGYASATRGETPASNNTYKRSCMIDRTILNDPVVIPNTESGIVVYSFEYGTDYE